MIKNIISSLNRIRIFWIFSKLVSRIQDSRVTIYILHGMEKKSKSDISILFFGKKDSLTYLSEVVYAYDPKIQKMNTIFIWSIQRILNHYSKNVDVIVAKTDKFFSYLLKKKGFIIIPEWIEMDMTIPKNRQTYFEMLGSSAKKDIYTLQKNGFSYEISNDSTKLDFFYYKMCLPYMMKRHGKLALLHLVDYNGVKRNFKRGFLLFVKEDQKYVAGSVIIVRKNVAYPVYMGIIDDEFYLHKGVGAALYHFPFFGLLKMELKQSISVILVHS
jgi:hypothetical protein